MRLFALEYLDFEIRAQAVRDLTWGQIVVLLHQVKDKTQREWYANQVILNGWSRPVLCVLRCVTFVKLATT